MAALRQLFQRGRGTEETKPDSTPSTPDSASSTSHQAHNFEKQENQGPQDYNKSTRQQTDDIESGNVEEEEIEDLPEDLRDIPAQVRNTVSFEDDPNEQCLTFRYFILVFIFIPLGAFVSQMTLYRTTQATFSVFFVQVASYYLGVVLARSLPAWQIKVPFTKWSFNTNPGPWGMKEHVLVTITAAQGATSNLGWTPISLAQLYFDTKIHPAACIFFMWAVVFIGYSYAILARQLLVYDPMYIWPQALMQTSLFETFRKSQDDSRSAKKQKHVFLIVLIGATIWEFLPEYVFPFLSSLSFLCWVAPHNKIANFVGAGIGGMGVLNISLDWANISYSGWGGNPLITPFWTSVIGIVAYVFIAWVLLPAAKWGNLGEWNHKLMSNRIFLQNGTVYPTAEIVDVAGHFNQTAFDYYGPPYMGLQVRWTKFFNYVSYTSAFSWILLFGGPKLKQAAVGVYRRFRNNKGTSAHFTYNDRLNVLQRSYKDVPWWCYVALFAASFITIIVMLAKGIWFIPIYTFIVAICMGAACVIPMGWLYAISNFQLAIGDTNELIYGYMIAKSTTHRHPAGASVYGAIAGDAWYRAQYLLQDQKIGHYMHIPPRYLFFSQIFAELIGVPVNYGVIQWVLKSKGDYLLGKKRDPTGQWTGQTLAGYNTNAIQYVVMGPARFFGSHMYQPLKWGYVVGAFLPVLFYVAHRFFPRLRIDMWNITIFASTANTFLGNMSTGAPLRFFIAWFSMYYLYRRRFDVWRRYNYIVAAALDAAYNIAVLLIFVIFSSGKNISMPAWWGNNQQSVERCFALEDN